MDIFCEEAVATWLVADGRTLIAPQYPVRIGDPTTREPVMWPDILAVQPKDRQIFLCEVTWAEPSSRNRDKIAKYRDHLENIRASLEHWLGIGDDGDGWQFSVWYFVPAAHVEKIEEMKTDDLRLKVTALEDLKPWTYTWGFREPDSNHA